MLISLPDSDSTDIASPKKSAGNMARRTKGKGKCVKTMKFKDEMFDVVVVDYVKCEK